MTERLQRKGSTGDSERTLSTHSKKVTRFTGIVAFPNLTFRSDDDGFNASDVIMSRISCSGDDRGAAFRVLALKSIQCQRTFTAHVHTLQTQAKIHHSSLSVHSL